MLNTIALRRWEQNRARWDAWKQEQHAIAHHNARLAVLAETLRAAVSRSLWQDDIDA